MIGANTSDVRSGAFSGARRGLRLFGRDLYGGIVPICGYVLISRMIAGIAGCSARLLLFSSRSRQVNLVLCVPRSRDERATEVSEQPESFLGLIVMMLAQILGSSKYDVVGSWCFRRRSLHAYLGKGGWSDSSRHEMAGFIDRQETPSPPISSHTVHVTREW